MADPWRRIQPDSVLGSLVAGGGLALAGGRFGRRAAMRGTLGLAAIGAVGNLAARCGIPGIPTRAAMAAAFAVGAGQELPKMVAPLVAAAAWPAIFAVRRRGLHPLAVVASVASSTGVAIGTRRLWPVAPHEAADLTTAMVHVEQTPSPEGRGLCVVVNATAGPALSGDPAEELRQALPEAEIIEVDDGTDLGAALERASHSSLAIGVAGGDGSINAGAEAAAEAGKPLMAVPAGTLNHLARDLGLISVADAVAAVRAGQTVAVDLATIDGRTFLNTASFGSYVDLVDARERLESTIGKWPAVAVALWRVLREADPVEVELDGRRRRLWMAFIGNCRYEPSGFSPSWRPRLDDGQLDIRVVDGSAPWSRARLVLALLTGTLGRCRAYEQWTARELRVRSLQGPIRLARDGETFDGTAEFLVAKCERPLAVYVPSHD